MSLGLNAAYIASHWDSVEEGVQKTGKQPSRRDWRRARHLCGETDAQAQDEALNGMLGRVWGEYSATAVWWLSVVFGVQA
jgi:hypothetical protein